MEKTLDRLYVAFFAIHIPATICVDLSAIYPPKYVPESLKAFQNWYVSSYKDPLLQSGAPWFKAFLWTEALVQLPIFFVALVLYSRGNKSTLYPLMLAYGAHSSTTVYACVAELLFNTSRNKTVGMTSADQNTLLAAYVPFGIITMIMVVDMFHRLTTSKVKVE